MPNTTPIGADALREALWICVEHNALHFGERHNTVVQGRAALANSAPKAAPAQPAQHPDDAAGDGTLHGAIDHWQQRALAAERVLVSRDAVLEEAAKACEAREALAGRADMKATCRLCAKAVRALKTHAAPQPAVQQGDAARVINAAREAMDESFEAGNDAMDISIPSHLAAALSLVLDEYDAARHAAPAAQGDACDAKHIAALTEIVRMPNAEYVADAHNAAVKYLRARAAKEGGEA